MPQTLKIVTWNCNGKFREKYKEIVQLNADIYIIKEWSQHHIWVGENKNKGLGVFFREDLKIKPLEWDSVGLKYFIPFCIGKEIVVIATWCHHANSPTFGYIGQLWKYLQLHKAKIIKGIVAGDLNSNAIWDKWDRWWNHSDVVQELSTDGIYSMYHTLTNAEHGKESTPTFFLQKNPQKPYHIDYVFASKILIPEGSSNIEIGEREEWIKWSDHMPITATLVI
jgi:hypothetical protein